MTHTFFSQVGVVCPRQNTPVPKLFKSVLNLQMTYIIIAHIYEQWDR